MKIYIEHWEIKWREWPMMLCLSIDFKIQTEIFPYNLHDSIRTLGYGSVWNFNICCQNFFLFFLSFKHFSTEGKIWNAKGSLTHKISRFPLDSFVRIFGIGLNKKKKKKRILFIFSRIYFGEEKILIFFSLQIF